MALIKAGVHLFDILRPIWLNTFPVGPILNLTIPCHQSDYSLPLQILYRVRSKVRNTAKTLDQENSS